MRTTLLVSSLIVATTGVAMLLIGWLTPSPSMLSAGASVLIAALVTMTAAAGMKTWSEERRRASDTKAREVYDQLARTLIARFGGGIYAASEEGALRASTSAWGSSAVVSALAEWNRAYDRHVAPSTTGTTTLSDEAQRDLKKATAAVVRAIRTDLKVGSLDDETIEQALFNTSRNSRADGSP